MNRPTRAANQRPRGREREHTLHVPMTSWQFDRLRLAAYSFGWPVDRWARATLVDAAEDVIAVDEGSRRTDR